MKHIKSLIYLSILSIFFTSATRPGEADDKNRLDWYDGDRLRQLEPDRTFRIIDKQAAGEENAYNRELSGKIPTNTVLISESKSYSIINNTDGPDLIDETTSPAYRAHGATDAAKYFPLGQVAIHLEEGHTIKNGQGLARQYGLEIKRLEQIPNTYLLNCIQKTECAEISTQLYEQEEVKYAYPTWIRQRSIKSLGNDPLFPQQWHLQNTGQSGIIGEDINAWSSWAFTSNGANHIIGIIDEGVEVAHPDLFENSKPGLHWDYVDGDDDPTAGAHGTSVAGIAGARGGNSTGVSGTAPFAGLAGIRLLDLFGFVSDLDEANALTHQNDQIAIYNNSWGPLDNGNLDGPSPMTALALEEGVTNGRQGRGNLYVWAAGNGRLANDNSNYDGYANQPYVIAVSATNSSGKQAYYSEPGANIWINAPGGDSAGWITTTDASGASGYSGTDYTSSFGGVSASTPQVAGVISMMLDQNPALSWRDVKMILAQTATQNDPADPDWVQNDAGFWINHKYGFGRVDALAAVTSATDHTSLPPPLEYQKSLSVGQLIPDNNPTGITSDITLEGDHEIEFVQATIDSNHPYWGDLQIELVSPAGTISRLSETHNSSGDQLNGGWTFGSARYLGESPAGNWQLRVSDGAALDAGTLNSWSIKIFAHRSGTPVARPIPVLSFPGLLLLGLLLIYMARVLRPGTGA